MYWIIGSELVLVIDFLETLYGMAVSVLFPSIKQQAICAVRIAE